MLLLTATTDKLQLVTSEAVTVDVHASYMDHTLSSDNVEGGRQNTAITTATTTDIVASPGSGVTRNVKTLHITNIHATSPVTVTVLYNQNGTTFTLHKVALAPGEMLEYADGVGFFVSKQSTIVQYSKVTSDLASYSTTPLVDAGPAFDVFSGIYYRFKFLILYQAAATTTGIRVSVAIPSVTRFAATASLPVSTAADGTANIFRGHITSSDDAVIGTGTPAANVDHIGEVEGIIVPSADGTIRLRYASELTTSAVTLRAGTMGILEQLP